MGAASGALPGPGFGPDFASVLGSGLLLAAINPALPLGLPIGPIQVQSLPALLLLLLGSLLIA